jgi:CRP-like cAMP-binding protein
MLKINTNLQPENVIKNLCFFKEGSEEFFSQLIKQHRILALEKGNLLFVSDEPATQFYIILEGWVKLFRETLDGTQAVIDILTSKHIFGETSIFQNNTYPYSAETTEPSTIIALPIYILKDELQRNPKFALTMLNTMANYRKDQDMELEHLTLQTAPQRIGCFILRLANPNIQQTNIIIHLPYDKTLIASRLGMQPETFSRALSKLKEATGIKIKGATVEMDSLEPLMKYACSACSSEFPCKDLNCS